MHPVDNLPRSLAFYRQFIIRHQVSKCWFSLCLTCEQEIFETSLKVFKAILQMRIMVISLTGEHSLNVVLLWTHDQLESPKKIYTFLNSLQIRALQTVVNILLLLLWIFIHRRHQQCRSCSNHNISPFFSWKTDKIKIINKYQSSHWNCTLLLCSQLTDKTTELIMFICRFAGKQIC